jgi:hypothetical protein
MAGETSHQTCVLNSRKNQDVNPGVENRMRTTTVGVHGSPPLHGGNQLPRR